MAEQVQYYGTGRRKSSVARVFLRPGDGKLVVNGREFDKYFLTGAQRVEVKQPRLITGTKIFPPAPTGAEQGINPERAGCDACPFTRKERARMGPAEDAIQ